MVRNKNISLIVIIALIVSSCATDRFGYRNKLYGKGYRETFGFHMWTLLESYSASYNKPPKSADDLICYIQGMDANGRMWYERECNYLKRNEGKLIITSDSLISMYYEKINEKNLFIRVPHGKPCDNIKTAIPEFFDENGHYFACDSLSRFAEKRLHRKYGVYFHANKDLRGTEITYEQVMLEYTPNNLKNLCSGEILDRDQSKYLTNIYDFLDSLACLHNLSRITTPIFMDKKT